MRIKEKVESIIRGIPRIVDPQISFTSEGDWHVVVTVMSDTFVGQLDDAPNDEIIWSALSKALSDEEMRRVEFVFTIPTRNSHT